jgi:hypothetical protein
MKRNPNGFFQCLGTTFKRIAFEVVGIQYIVADLVDQGLLGS